MCRLFGLIADTPVSIENPILEGIKPFVELSYKHHDGWGIGYVDGCPPGEKSIRVVKSDYPAWKDEHFSRLIKHLVSCLAIVHLRDAKYGPVALRNTHPFFAEGWIFAHNGSLRNFRKIERELRGKRFSGETDSERYFYLLLKHIKQKEDVPRGVRSAIEWLHKNYIEGAKNFLMSDGNHIYAYREGRELYYVEREVPISPIEPLRRILGGSLGNGSGEALAEGEVNKTARMVVIASEILTDESWHEVPESHLLIVNDKLQVVIEPILEKAGVPIA
ncbi:MAG: class II glutamine amidotransferase [Firmicutes bacterium]|nr:class II glutamine amidotransferase [Bacillota bacterium]